MNEKIRIACIKFNGLGAGGTERWLQNVAAGLNKDKFSVDYFYTGAEDAFRKAFMLQNNINLIKVAASGKVSDYGEWVDTDLWEKFDQNKYDLVQTAIAGNTEWPFYLLKKPVIHKIALDYAVDFSPNVYHNFFLSEWMRNKWVRMGGIRELSSVVPVGLELPASNDSLRQELGIPAEAVVAGYHQRVDDNIFSDIPLKAFAEIQGTKRFFVIMGGSKKYAEQAKALGIHNFIQLEHSADTVQISKFLNTLNMFSHGRKDGETFGTVFAEALLHKLPCLGHKTRNSNAHKETMGPGGFFANNQAEYTNKLKLLFEDSNTRSELVKAGFAYAKTMFIDTDYIADIEKKYEEIYRNDSNLNSKVKHLHQINRIINNKFWLKIKKVFRRF